MGDQRHVYLRNANNIRLGFDQATMETAHFARATARILNKLLRKDRFSYECGLEDLKAVIEKGFERGINPCDFANLLNRDLTMGVTASYEETSYVRLFAIRRKIHKKEITIMEMSTLLPKGMDIVVNMGTTFLGIFDLNQLKHLIEEIRSASQPDLAVILNELVRLNSEQLNLMKLEARPNPLADLTILDDSPSDRRALPSSQREALPTN